MTPAQAADRTATWIIRLAQFCCSGVYLYLAVHVWQASFQLWAAFFAVTSLWFFTAGARRSRH